MVGEESVVAGSSPLCYLRTNEIAAVDYWLYLEGCDEHCFNVVQNADVALQLAFAGAS